MDAREADFRDSGRRRNHQICFVHNYDFLEALRDFRSTRTHDRASWTIFHALEAHRDDIAPTGGGSIGAPARAPRTSARTSDVEEDDDGGNADPEPEQRPRRHSPVERLLRLPEVLSIVGVGKTTVYALINAGEFPRPRKVRNLSVWVQSEVQDWVKSVIAA